MRQTYSAEATASVVRERGRTALRVLLKPSRLKTGDFFCIFRRRRTRPMSKQTFGCASKQPFYDNLPLCNFDP